MDGQLQGPMPGNVTGGCDSFHPCCVIHLNLSVWPAWHVLPYLHGLPAERPDLLCELLHIICKTLYDNHTCEAQANIISDHINPAQYPTPCRYGLGLGHALTHTTLAQRSLFYLLNFVVVYPSARAPPS